MHGVPEEGKKLKGAGTCGQARSAIGYLFKEYRKSMPKCIKNLSTFFEGLKRDAARQPGSKSRKDSGKRPMEFAVYKFLSAHLMRCTNADALFVRAYLLISWNLMCRSGNTCSVALSHMRCMGR